MTTQATEQARLARAQNELTMIDVEARLLLKAAGAYFDALARAAAADDTEEPLAADFANRIRALLDRRTLVIADVYEQAREMGIDPVDSR